MTLGFKKDRNSSLPGWKVVCVTAHANPTFDPMETTSCYITFLSHQYVIMGDRLGVMEYYDAHGCLNCEKTLEVKEDYFWMYYAKQHDS